MSAPTTESANTTHTHDENGQEIQPGTFWGGDPISESLEEDDGVDFWCTECEEEYVCAMSLIAGRQLCEDCERAWNRQQDI